MDYATYQRRVLARASHRWHNKQLSQADLNDTLADFIDRGNRLDRAKKALMYGRRFSWHEDAVPGSPVSAEGAVRVPSERDQRIIHAILGVATEGVEMIEALYKYFYKGSFDITNLQEEFGDVEWYRALFLDAVGQTDEANREQNDAKLEKRYGSTFTEAAANERDLEGERQVLQAGKPGGPGFEDLAPSEDYTGDDYRGPRC